MKNDIDRLLDDIFSSNSSGKTRAVSEAEQFLANLENKKLDVEKVNLSAQEQLKSITEQLKADGLMEENSIEDKKVEGDAFKNALEQTKTQIVGQDEFLKKMLLSFKRPTIMGYPENKPATVAIANGKTGTGRHSSVKNLIKSLSSQNLIKGDSGVYIDLSLYQNQENEQIFIQDIFSAVNCEKSVIIFENIEKCHRSILNKISELVVNGEVLLKSRYAEQKGMLINVGNALVKNAISSIKFENKYVVFITNLTENKITDMFGSEFINNVSDICTTGEFSRENIFEISNNITKSLFEKCLNKLDFKINSSDEVTDYFVMKYSLVNGINSINDFANECFKILSEYKLFNDVSSKTFDVKIDDNRLSFVSGNTTLSVEKANDDNTALKAVKAQIDEIIGLDEIKNYVLSLEDNYKMKKLRSQKGLKTQNLSMHMIFTGNPGTGKTTIARLISRYLKAVGVLTGGQLIEVTRADLVGQYVGHTAPLTKQIINSAIGGVLFIDEAYSLYRSKDDTFGIEAIDTLVKCMEDNRDNLLVILAGYTKEMEYFLESNSGLVSRFPNVIEFPDYSAEELYKITQLIAKNKGYKIADEMHDELIEYYNEKQKDNSDTSGNGRMARNILESAILEQSKRIINTGDENYEQLLKCDFTL